MHANYPGKIYINQPSCQYSISMFDRQSYYKSIKWSLNLPKISSKRSRLNDFLHSQTQKSQAFWSAAAQQQLRFQVTRNLSTNDLKDLWLSRGWHHNAFAVECLRRVASGVSWRFVPPKVLLISVENDDVHIISYNQQSIPLVRCFQSASIHNGASFDLSVVA